MIIFAKIPLNPTTLMLYTYLRVLFNLPKDLDQKETVSKKITTKIPFPLCAFVSRATAETPSPSRIPAPERRAARLLESARPEEQNCQAEARARVLAKSGD